MGAQSIKIPVELELKQLQNSIQALKKALDKVKPGTKAYENLSKSLDKIEHQFYSLENASKKSFKNVGEINSFEKAFEKVANSISDVASDFKRLNFADLSADIFSKEDIQRIQEASNKIKKVQTDIDNLRSDKFKEVANSSDEIKKAFSDLEIDIDTSNIDDAIKSIRNNLKGLSNQIGGKTRSINAKKNQLNLLETQAAAISALRTGQGLTLAEKFGANFFDNTGKAFKDENSKQALVEMLAGLGLNKANLIKVQQSTAADLENFSDNIINTLKASAAKMQQDIDKIKNTELPSLDFDKQQLVAAKANQDAALKQLNTIDPSLTAELNNYKQQLEEARNELIALKQELAHARVGQEVFNKVNQDSADSVQNLGKNCNEAKDSLENFNRAQEKLNDIKFAIKNWFGFNEVINLTKNAVRNMITQIRELDDVMTQIAIVTDMTQKELWDQMDTYSAMAQQYGASIKGVYEVSQLYYQQGLQTAEVMNLTEETLKMAKIANLDYAEATDYMTVALRGFKLEMSDAQQVTDVYSALAAATASDTEELAVAMSKTASSAEAVGSSFESTSAMIATMISITREAPENIGSALKSIISRYGEMTSDPMKLVDSEGEEMSLNKVDKALQSVGISLQNAQGQFRDFDDVILELSKSWDTIDTNTQRYIATVMAGNRQQSRFLALVGNYEEYAKALEVAENAEDAGTLQTLKTMDSISTKWEQLKVSLQEFYTSAGLEDVFKGVLDALNAFLTKANDIPKLFGKIPVSVIALVSSLISSIKNVATSLTSAAIGPIKEFNEKLNELKNRSPLQVEIKTKAESPEATNQTLNQIQQRINQNGPIVQGQNKNLNKEDLENNILSSNNNIKNLRKQIDTINKSDKLTLRQKEQYTNKLNGFIGQNEAALKNYKKQLEELQKQEVSMPKTSWIDKVRNSSTGNFLAKHAGSISLVTSALSALALTMKDTSSAVVEGSKTISGGLNTIGGLALGIFGGQWQYAIPMLISGIPTLIDGIIYTTEEKLKNATEKATELSNTALQSKSDYRTLKNEISELEDLTSARYNSAEAMQEYLDYSNQMADKYPELIDYIDSEGNAVIDLSDKYEVLETKRLAAAEAAAKSAMAELEVAKLGTQNENENYYKNLTGAIEDIQTGFEINQLFPVKEIEQELEKTFSDSLRKVVGEEQFSLLSEEMISVLEDIYTNQDGLGFADIALTYGIKDPDSLYKQLSNTNAVVLQQDVDLTEAVLQDINNSLVGVDEELQSFLTDALSLDIEDKESVNIFSQQLLENQDSLIALTKTTEDGTYLLDGKTRNFIHQLLNLIPVIKADQRAIKLAEFQQRVADNQALSTATYWKGQELLTGDNKSSYRVLDEMSTANKIIDDYLKEKQGDLSFDDYYSDVEKFDADYTAVTEQLADLWNNLLVTGKSDELNQIIGDLGSYSENNLREALNNIGVTNEEDINLIISSWEENYSNAFENFKKARKEQITKLSESSGKHITGGASLGDLAPKYYASILEQFAFINSQVEKNIIKANQGQIYANNLTSLWEKAETDLKFGDLLQEADLTSLSGIYDFRQAIIDAGYSINDFDTELSTLAANIKINVVTETDSLISKLNTSLKTFGEEIAKASEGMDLEEALKVAEKLDMSIADFKFEDGEFKMEGEPNFQKLYDAYVGENKELQNQLKTEIDNEIKNLEVKQIGTLGYSFTKEDGEQLNQLRILRDNLDKIVGDYNKQLLQTFLLQNKSYQEYFNNLFADKQISETDTNELVAAARQGEQDFRNLLVQKGLEMTNVSVEAFMRTIEGTYDDIIGIINEGKGLVNLTEFDWSPEETLDTSDAEAVQNYYKRLFEDNTEKFNEAWIGYLENQQISSKTAIANIASDLDSIDVSAIGELADSLGLYVTDLIKYFNLNEDGTYSTSVNNIRVLMSDFSIKTTSEIEDTLREYLNNIVSILAGGIEGSATEVEIDSLQEYLNSTGAEIEIKTFETAEGLKITENSVLQIYSHLKNVNSLAAKTTLETLAKTAMDSDESMNDVYKVLKKIDDLESKPSNERTVEYEAQLDICKEVLKTLQKADDTFNFMNRDLPSGMDDPLSAWEGMGDAFKVLDSDDFKAGRIAYQDYYNMITQMEAMGVDLSSMASGFNTNAERAAALLQAGGKALSNVDGETFVDLSKLGTNFNIGAEGMKKGLTEGIHTLAQNQIDILDAEIALLETVVKTQEAFDSISGEDNEIDISELMPQFNSEGVREWSENQEEVISFMASYAGETIIPTIDGAIITINDLYSDPSLWDKLSLSGKKLLTNFSNALKDIIGEQDWSTLTGENSQLLQDKINQILKDLGINQRITIDPDKVTKGITFVSSETSGDIYTKLSEAFGSTWSEIPVVLKSNLVKYIQEKLSSSEEGKISLTLSDLIDFIVPEGTDPETQALRQQLYASLTSTIEEITPETVEGTTTTVQNKVNSVTKATLHGTWTAEGVSGEFGNQEDAYNAWLNANKTTETETLENVSAEATLEISAVTETKLAEGVQPEAGFELTEKVKVTVATDPLEITSVANPTLAEEVKGNEETPINIGNVGIISGTASTLKVTSFSNPTITDEVKGNIITPIDIGDIGFAKGTVSGLKISIPENLNADSIDLINQFNSAISAAAANATVNSGITVTIAGLDEDGVSNIESYNEAVKELPTGNITSTVTGDITIPLDVLTNILALKNAVLALKNDPNVNATISATAEENAISLIADILSVYGYSGQTAQLLFNATDNETINAIITKLEEVVGKEIDITANLDDAQAQKDLADLTAPETKVITVTYDSPPLVGPGIDTSATGYHVAGVENTSGNKITIGQYSTLKAAADDIAAEVANGTFQNGIFEIAEIKADGTTVTTTANLVELTSGNISFGNNNNPQESSLAPNISFTPIDTTTLDQAKIAISQAIAFSEAKIQTLAEAIEDIPDKATDVQATADAISNLENKTVSVSVSYPKKVTIDVDVKVSSSGGKVSSTITKQNTSTGGAKVPKPSDLSGAERPYAKGNVALATGTRKTLMGELGPELVVSDGRYFLVGQNGAEFVDLADDAIVFNHLQTKKLLSSGSSGYGKPVTNEKNAVSFATGNVDGPAMASASAALAQLRQIRAMWQALLDASLSDLGSKAGLGGKGGGGGGAGNADDSAIPYDLEKWYNWLRKIAQLEQEITLEQAKRENMANGADRAQSLSRELDLIKEQLAVEKELANEQYEYYKKRAEEVNNSIYGKVFSFDEKGLMQFKEGEGYGLDLLEKIKSEEKATDQLSAIKDIFKLKDTDYLLYDENGQKVNTKDMSDEEIAKVKVENFFNNMDATKEELEELYDSVYDHQIKAEELQTRLLEIEQERIDHQLELEQTIYDTLVDIKERQIKNAEDYRDTIQEASKEYLEGLNKALDNELKMYNANQEFSETSKLQNRLAILQRSGGSASEIKALQEQIDSRLKDAYFQEQQDQIDAIQAASDAEIERLDTQISLMEDTLAYERENGLIWDEVSEWMGKSIEEIVDLYTKNNEDYLSKSELGKEEAEKEFTTQVQQQKETERLQGIEDNASKYVSGQISNVPENVKISDIDKAKAEQAYKDAYEKTEGSESEKKAAAEAAAKAIIDEAILKGTTSEKPSEGDGKEDEDEISSGLQAKLKGGQMNLRKRASSSESSTILDIIKDGQSLEVVGYNGRWLKVENAGKNKLSGYMKYSGYEKYYSGLTKEVLKKIPGFSKGGLIDFTGLAMVHGSKSRPESFISAEHTKLLKESIFSKNNNSIKELNELFSKYKESMKNITNENDSSINIENVNISVHTGAISNGYDARRAGQEIFDEMVRISRKTGNVKLSRR